MNKNAGVGQNHDFLRYLSRISFSLSPERTLDSPFSVEIVGIDNVDIRKI